MQSHRIAPNNQPSKLGGATTIPRLTQMLTCRSYMDTNFGVAVSQMVAFGIVMKIPTSSSGYPLPPSPVRAWSSSDPTMAKNGLLSPLLRLHPLFPPLPLSALVALSVFAYNAHRRSRSLVHCFARICRQFGESIRARAVAVVGGGGGGRRACFGDYYAPHAGWAVCFVF